jgi:hypothetical protein
MNAANIVLLIVHLNNGIIMNYLDIENKRVKRRFAWLLYKTCILHDSVSSALVIFLPRAFLITGIVFYGVDG